MNLDDIVREFLVESYENLDRLDQALVALETRPADSALLADIFRTIHTLKGTAGFLAFTKLEAISHVGENLLSALRDQKLTLTPGITSTLLRMVDAVRALLGSIEATGVEDDRDYAPLIADLTRQLSAGAVAEAEAAAWQPGDEDRRSGDDRRAPGDDRDRRQGISESSLRVDVGLLDKLMNLVGELVLARNLSRDVLVRAKAGCYSQIEVNRGLPITYLVKYFEKHGAEWRLVPRIRERVEFQQMNLVQAWPMMPAFDVVFIRNVMIYFDITAKRSILERIGRLLPRDGYLFLGAAETTMNLDDRFRRAPFERAGCYQLAA